MEGPASKYNEVQPRPEGFSLKKNGRGARAPTIFLGKVLGTRLDGVNVAF